MHLNPLDVLSYMILNDLQSNLQSDRNLVLYKGWIFMRFFEVESSLFLPHILSELTHTCVLCYVNRADSRPQHLDNILTQGHKLYD